MLSFTIAPTHLLLVQNFSTNLRSSRKAPRKWENLLVSVQFSWEKETAAAFLGFLDLRERNYRDCSRGFTIFAKRRRKGRECEEGLELEAEILEFMKNSENPEAFPSKKQLLDVGRMDLVEGIVKQGGWLCFGWESDDDNDNENHENGVLRHNDDGDCKIR